MTDITERRSECRAEIRALDEQIGAPRLQARGSHSKVPRDQQEAVRRLLSDMASKSSEEVYAIRARLSLALSAVVERVTFYSGGVVMVMFGGGRR